MSNQLILKEYGNQAIFPSWNKLR